MFKRKGYKGPQFGLEQIQCEIDVADPVPYTKMFGCCRFVYNWALAFNKERYANGEKHLGYVELQNMLPALKKEYPFLQGTDSTALQQALQDYNQSMQQLFQHKAGPPTFRCRYKNDTCRIINVFNKKGDGRIRINGNKIVLPKLGTVKIKPHQAIPEGKIKSVTIKRTTTGKIFITLLIERADAHIHLPKTGKEIGIDLGIKDYAVLSDGTKIAQPAFMKQMDKKIRHLHKELSRCKKGSNNFQKAAQRLRKAYEKLSNMRNDFQHKLALDLIREYDTVVVEHLDVRSMLQEGGHKMRVLHKSIQDSAWYLFRLKLEYKAKKFGKQLVTVDTFFPSSQICHDCGYKNTDTKNLHIRDWVCPVCGSRHDRDVNAAINILNEGKRIQANPA